MKRRRWIIDFNLIYGAGLPANRNYFLKVLASILANIISKAKFNLIRNEQCRMVSRPTESLAQRIFSQHITVSG